MQHAGVTLTSSSTKKMKSLKESVEMRDAQTEEMALEKERAIIVSPTTTRRNGNLPKSNSDASILYPTTSLKRITLKIHLRSKHQLRRTDYLEKR